MAESKQQRKCKGKENTQFHLVLQSTSEIRQKFPPSPRQVDAF